MHRSIGHIFKSTPMRMKWVCLLAVMQIVISSKQNTSLEYLRNVVSTREQIMNYIFENYHQDERPGQEERMTTLVTVDIVLTAITSVDFRMMEYTAYLLIRQEWHDARLAWDQIPQFKNYTKNLVTPELKRNLWFPDLFFRNGKEGRLHKMTCANYLTRITPSGSVLYSQKINMKFSCQMDLTVFPMDSQLCHMNIGSYGYSLNELRFLWKNITPVNITPGMQISEFNSPKSVITHDCNAGPIAMSENSSCLNVMFILSRQLGSWFSSVYIPNFLIIVASWHSFWVDVDAQPARVALGLLTLLGMITQASGVSSTLPRVSYIKAIDVWNIACIIFNVGVLIEFAVAANMLPKKKPERWRREARNALRNELTNWCVTCRSGFVEHNFGPSSPHNPFSEKDIERKLMETLYPNVKTRGRTLASDILMYPEQRASSNVEGEAGGDSDSENSDFADFSETNCLIRRQDRRRYAPVSKIDRYSRILFPLCFLFYNCFYWTYYLEFMKRV